MNSTYFGPLAEFGETNVPLVRVAPKYFGLSLDEAKRRASAQSLPCRVFRLGGQNAPWLVSMSDLAELIDKERERAGRGWRRVADRDVAEDRVRHPLQTEFKRLEVQQGKAREG